MFNICMFLLKNLANLVEELGSIYFPEVFQNLQMNFVNEMLNVFGIFTWLDWHKHCWGSVKCMYRISCQVDLV